MPISLGCLHNAQRSLPRKSAGILRAGHATRRSCPKQCSTPEPRRRCYSSSDRWYRMFVDATALALAQRYRIHVRDRRAAPRKELRYLGFVAKNASSPLVPSTYLYIALYPSCSWQGRHPPSPLSRPCPRLDSHICPGGGGDLGQVDRCGRLREPPTLRILVKSRQNHDTSTILKPCHSGSTFTSTTRLCPRTPTPSFHPTRFPRPCLSRCSKATR